MYYIQTILLSFLFLFQNSLALADSDFQYFTLTNQLKQNSLNLASYPENNLEVNQEINQEMIELLSPVEINPNNNPPFAAQENTQKMVIPWENIYQILLPILLGQGQQESWDKLNQLLQHKQQFNLGIKNFSGMSWQKPTGYISLSAFRDFQQKENSTLVIDTLTISIDAQSFLEHLSDKKLINISKSSLTAFAGLSFLKSFKTTTQVDSLNNAHKLPLTSLLFPFQFQTIRGLKNLPPNSKTESHESFGFQFSLEAQYQIFPFLAAGISASQQIRRVSSLLIDHSQDNFYEINFQKLTESQTTINAGVALDFYKLLGITLFKFDYSKVYSQKISNNFGISEDRRAQLENQYGQVTLLKKLQDQDNEGQNFMWKEKIESSSNIFNGKFLFWSRGSSDEKSKVELSSPLSQKHYQHEYRSRFHKIGSIFNGLLYYFLGIFTKVVNLSDRLAYSDDFQFVFDQKRDWTLRLSTSFQANKWKGMFGKKVKNETIQVIRQQSSQAAKFIELIAQGKLTPPIYLSTIINLGASQLQYVTNLYEDQQYIAAAKICKIAKSDSWWNVDERSRNSKNLRRKTKRCFQHIFTLLQSIKNSSDYHHQVNSFKRLSKFMQDERVDLSTYYYALGVSYQNLEENFSAKQNDQINYQWKKTTTLVDQSVFDIMKELWINQKVPY